MTKENMVEDAELRIAAGRDDPKVVEALIGGYLIDSGVDDFVFSSQVGDPTFQNGVVFTAPSGKIYKVIIETT